MIRDAYEVWLDALDRLNAVDADPHATRDEITRAELNFLCATNACERACAEYDREEARLKIAACRADAIERIGEAGRLFGRAKSLPKIVETIAANAEAETNLIFNAWQPGDGARAN